MTRDYDLLYYVAKKCVNYRDTGVSKKACPAFQKAVIIIVSR
jgi:hypothetical protein